MDSARGPDGGGGDAVAAGGAVIRDVARYLVTVLLEILGSGGHLRRG